jgi:hypothetical protein
MASCISPKFKLGLHSWSTFSSCLVVAAYKTAISPCLYGAPSAVGQRRSQLKAVMDGSVVSTQTAPSAGPRHYYGEPLNVPYGCSATAQEESWAIGAGSVDPRKLQSTAVQTHRKSDSSGVAIPLLSHLRLKI